MINLAGKPCDDIIKAELEQAGINVICLPGEKDKHPEVKATMFGFLGGKHTLEEFEKYPVSDGIWNLMTFKSMQDSFSFSFYRNWYYYVVSGYVPMEAAIELYEHPIGKKDVRVEGHCGCPDPREYCANTPLIAGHRCVSCYHIDSQEGLNLFVDVLRRHKLFE